VPKKTEKNLAYAFAAESKAAVRNAAFAQKAEKENLSQIAHLFRAISEAELVHAKRFLDLMQGKIGSTEENLETAFNNEIKANVDEYPALVRDAIEEEMEAAVKVFSYARDVEAGHAELYKNAINAMFSDRHTNYYVCQVCGYVSDGSAPEKCPVCGAARSSFKKVE